MLKLIAIPLALLLALPLTPANSAAQLPQFPDSQQARSEQNVAERPDVALHASVDLRYKWPTVQLVLVNLEPKPIHVSHTSRPIFCGNVKPENILLARDGHITQDYALGGPLIGLPVAETADVASGDTLRDRFDLCTLEPGTYELVGMFPYELGWSGCPAGQRVALVAGPVRFQFNGSGEDDTESDPASESQPTRTGQDAAAYPNVALHLTVDVDCDWPRVRLVLVNLEPEPIRVSNKLRPTFCESGTQENILLARDGQVTQDYLRSTWRGGVAAETVSVNPGEALRDHFTLTSMKPGTYQLAVMFPYEISWSACRSGKRIALAAGPVSFRVGPEVTEHYGPIAEQ